MSLNRLIDVIKLANNNVSTLPSESSSPQLETLIISLCEAIKKDAKGAPNRIKDIITTALNTFGWNISTNTNSNPHQFNKTNILTGLSKMIEELSNWSPVVIPTTEELSSLSQACDRLWDLDSHRLVPEKDYEINLQNGKRTFEDGDFATDSLFTYVQDEVFNRATVKAFVALLDNYSSNIGTFMSMIF
jgi:hypothetical protein